MAPEKELPAMRSNPKFIFFTDFDGTITIQDSNDYMTDHLGFGSAERKRLNEQVLDGDLAFRRAFWLMMESIKEPFDHCMDDLVKNIELDDGFKTFLEYAGKNNIPVVVLSGGMTPIIKALLKHLVGEDADSIEIVSNDVGAKSGKDINDEDGWEITFHDDSHYGHDKSLTIRPYAELPADRKPTMFYAGDGVSDLSAARETDLLFAKRGRDLVSYCIKEDIPFTVFSDWNEIMGKVQDIVEGKMTVQEAAAEGHKLAKTKHMRDRHQEESSEASGHTTPVVPEAGGGSKPRGG